MSTFTCHACGALCVTPMTEEEFIAEYEKRTGETYDEDEVVELCDKCAKRYEAWLASKKGN